MWKWLFSRESKPPAPVVLVPPLFDFPPIAARNRMLHSAYDVAFGKIALASLFQDYFHQARHFTTRLMLKPIDDPHVDLIATVTGPLDRKPNDSIMGDALFRWQSDVNDPHTFMDLYVSTSDPILQMRSCAFYSKYGFGAFGVFPLLLKKRESSQDYGLMGLRYGSGNLSFGVTLMPFALKDELPKSAWLVSKMGRVTAGVQFEPQKRNAKLSNLTNWSCALGYGVGSGSPLCPSFNFNLELVKSSQFIASFYQHMVVQRRVKNPLEENSVVGITNYLDFGFELLTSVDEAIAANNISDASFQIGASWQANKNFLLKAKVGPRSSSMALAFKSWWKPSFTLSISATRDRGDGKMQYGFGIQSESLREASYQRADPNFVMLTPSKEHLAEGIIWETGKRPMFQSDIDAGHFDGLPKELRPFDKIL
ncbi:uncharacterized protein HKW66_Vig0256230 [Vigna angularis]|uniref:Uncharacterized protein n=2 Tax=Phaseolus angularis TaxID=3914 RepID=A0A8T0JVW3_PHAAN|nr:uncharacterized protein LOC108346152 [Vigna angularis]KAG2383780.1 uncharacterized protein HKW66_Vig0256230 [Vigna angularis]BAU01016.1 hypothetical protein VIGAN_11016800 [Vigna angularis var. angularis]